MTKLLCTLLTLAATMCGCDATAPTAPDVPHGGVVDCARFPPQASSAYVLPYAIGQEATVSRTFEHGLPQSYAVDFLRHIGSVVAARAGLVVEIDEPWRRAGHNAVPVSVRNTRPHTCGLTSGAGYTALPL